MGTPESCMPYLVLEGFDCPDMVGVKLGFRRSMSVTAPQEGLLSMHRRRCVAELDGVNTKTPPSAFRRRSTLSSTEN